MQRYSSYCSDSSWCDELRSVVRHFTSRGTALYGSWYGALRVVVRHSTGRGAAYYESQPERLNKISAGDFQASGVGKGFPIKSVWKTELFPFTRFSLSD